jgi:hypothetical protein
VSRPRDAYLRRWDIRIWGPGVSVWVSRSLVFVLLSDRGGRVYRGFVLQSVFASLADAKQRIADRLWEDQAMKRKAIDKGKRVRQLADPAGLDKTHPRLAEWMTCGWFEDTKEPRLGPTLTVWCVSGEWRASLKDRAEQLVCWLSAPTYAELMEMADAFCQSGEAPWRHDEQGTPEKGKRVRQGGQAK